MNSTKFRLQMKFYCPELFLLHETTQFQQVHFKNGDSTFKLTTLATVVTATTITTRTTTATATKISNAKKLKRIASSEQPRDTFLLLNLPTFDSIRAKHVFQKEKESI